ncbi:MAG: hypothetical protein JWN67_1988 [Actinomycetia bacterium]|nr:hypothetical protein [Actinomycetes bacterium]
MAVTPTSRRRRRLLAAALAGTPLVVPAWAALSAQHTYDGNRVVGGTTAPVVIDVPVPAPAPASIRPVVTLPAAVGPTPAAQPGPDQAPEPASAPIVAMPPPPVEPIDVTPDVEALPVIDAMPPIDWAALEQLAAFFATLPLEPPLEVVEPTALTPLAEELLP